MDWIEAVQAGTNASLDLDLRLLPKVPTLPRRRRRRRRTITDDQGEGAGNATREEQLEQPQSDSRR